MLDPNRFDCTSSGGLCQKVYRCFDIMRDTADRNLPGLLTPNRPVRVSYKASMLPNESRTRPCIRSRRYRRLRSLWHDKQEIKHARELLRTFTSWEMPVRTRSQKRVRIERVAIASMVQIQIAHAASIIRATNHGPDFQQKTTLQHRPLASHAWD